MPDAPPQLDTESILGRVWASATALQVEMLAEADAEASTILADAAEQRRALVADGERLKAEMVAAGQIEAHRIVTDAQNERLVVLGRAETGARSILAQAQSEAARIRAEALAEVDARLSTYIDLAAAPAEPSSAVIDLTDTEPAMANAMSSSAEVSTTATAAATPPVQPGSLQVDAALEALVRSGSADDVVPTAPRARRRWRRRSVELVPLAAITAVGLLAAVATSLLA